MVDFLKFANTVKCFAHLSETKLFHLGFHRLEIDSSRGLQRNAVDKISPHNRLFVVTAALITIINVN